jgi:hypothetical protein
MTKEIKNRLVMPWQGQPIVPPDSLKQVKASESLQFTTQTKIPIPNQPIPAD